MGRVRDRDAGLAGEPDGAGRSPRFERSRSRGAPDEPQKLDSRAKSGQLSVKRRTAWGISDNVFRETFLSRTDFRTASDVDAELAVGVAAKMFAAAAFDDRWDAIRKTLEMLGASAVNVAALCRRSALPFWFRSSPPPRKLSDYVSEGLMASDLIIRHAAASSAPFHWRTADRTGHEDDPARRAFVNFVRDSGHRSIVCLTVRPKRGADVRVVTFCSEHAPGEVMTDAHLRRIEMAIRLLLPWLDWPERAEGPGFLPVSGPELSPRQTQALRLFNVSRFFKIKRFRW